MTTLPLWFIKAQCPWSDQDWNLLVHANNAEQAEAIWRDYYAPDYTRAPESVRQVPTALVPGAVDWGSIT